MAFNGQPVTTTIKNIGRGKVSDGKSINVIVPESTEIKAQEFYEINGFFGMAVEGVKTKAGETAEIALQIEQAEYETNNIVAEDKFEVGEDLYFNDGKFTTKTEGRLVGKVSNSKDSNNTIWFIMLPQQPKATETVEGDKQ